MHLDFTIQPRTLTEAVDLLLAGLDDQDRRDIASMSPESTHFGFGMNLRNEWGLWLEHTPLVQWFRRELQIGHADDMSGIILGSFWAAVLGQTFDVQAEVRRYHTHWLNQGIDPVTQERLPSTFTTTNMTLGNSNQSSTPIWKSLTKTLLRWLRNTNDPAA